MITHCEYGLYEVDLTVDEAAELAGLDAIYRVIGGDHCIELD